MLDDYTMGKIAAHAYVDELQRLNLGYEVLVEKTAAGGYGAVPTGESAATWAEKVRKMQKAVASRGLGVK